MYKRFYSFHLKESKHHYFRKNVLFYEFPFGHVQKKCIIL